jgi:16S rRNA (uracil1498-N3)-methyltransferase
MQRFYLPPENFGSDYIISKDSVLIKQLISVLRAKEGAKFLVFNGDGRERLVQLIELTKKQVKFLIINDEAGRREPSREIHLYMALVKTDKLDWIVQKATELGAASITPFVSSRCVAKDLSPAKLFRLKQIAKEATEQCGGSRLPEISPAKNFKLAVDEAKRSDGLNLLAWEEESDNGLAEVENKKINLFIGPEGGFDKTEVETAQKAGFQIVSLGQRILRAETAAIASLAVLLIA